ncbi:tigger transposable element-derived protein 3-like [Bacillus rossius redtenbacheri]|uniref:tigger transposable element-derived protein 3-like n=1 Tax=Bacillus rossius redtenbacheri TaxID=93214 RepID=UPI002FDE7368
MLESGNDPTTLKFNILDALHNIAYSWNKVQPETIANCFKKAGFFSSGVTAVEELSSNDQLDEEVAKLQAGVSFIDFVEVNSDDVTTEIEDLNDIVNNHLTENASVDCQDSEEDEDGKKPIPTQAEATQAVCTLKKFVSSFNNAEDLIPTLHKLEVDIEHLCRLHSKQSHISDFFKKL